jgi:hypothetical protein
MLYQIVNQEDEPICLIETKDPFNEFMEEFNKYPHTISDDIDEFLEYMYDVGLIVERVYIDQIIKERETEQ